MIQRNMRALLLNASLVNATATVEMPEQDWVRVEKASLMVWATSVAGTADLKIKWKKRMAQSATYGPYSATGDTPDLSASTATQYAASPELPHEYVVPETRAPFVTFAVEGVGTNPADTL